MPQKKESKICRGQPVLLVQFNSCQTDVKISQNQVINRVVCLIKMYPSVRGHLINKRHVGKAFKVFKWQNYFFTGLNVKCQAQTLTSYINKRAKHALARGYH